MEYKQLGNSELILPELIFGCWSVGYPGDPDRKDIVAALRKAYELGCSAIDTAPTYGMGVSEEVVAEAIAGIPRDKIRIMTKCGVKWEGSDGTLVNTCTIDGKYYEIYQYAGKDSIIRECEDSLRRLKTDYIDHYSLHWPDPTTPIEETMEAFIRLKEQGKILSTGVVNHSLRDMKIVENEIDIVSAKVRYSMLNRTIEKDIIPHAIAANKGILAFSVLQRGILTGRNLPKFQWPKDNPWEVALYEPENMSRIRQFLDRLTPIAEGYGATLTHLCTRWAMRQPGITVVLLGASNAAQVVDDAKALDISLSSEDMASINHLLAGLENELVLEPSTSL